MYKTKATVFLLFLTFSLHGTVYGMDDLYLYSKEEVKDQMATLDKLEQLHAKFPEKTLKQLIHENGMEGFVFVNKSILQNGHNDPRLPVPAFWFGCFLGWIGLLLVYTITQDSFQIKSALWGFVINFMFGCSIFTIFILNW